jgi:hypothetical protein
LAPGLGDEPPISVEPVQERPFPNENSASGPADDEPFRLEQADGLADGLVSCAVALDQFAFGRQLVPRCEHLPVDMGPQLVGDLPIRRSWIGRIDAHVGKVSP